MSRLLVGFLATTLLGWSQSTEKPVPTSKERAREILDKAIDTVSGTQPEVQVAGLLHLADIYAEFDKKRSEELFRQAFAAASALPDENKSGRRGEMMAEVARTAAQYNVDVAMEFLQQLGPPQSGRRDDRIPIINAITQQLIKDKRVGRAAELITSLGSQGEFAFNAASSVLKAVPEGDPLKIELFSSALAAYTVRPIGPFSDFVARNWRHVPPQMAESAVNAMINALSEKKKNDDESFTQTMSTSKGAVSFSSRENAELFNVIHIIRAVNPKKADDLLESRLELRDAIARFPEGKQSMFAEGNESMNTSTSSGSKSGGSGPSAEMQLQAMSSTKSQEARAALKENPDKALALVREIPLDQQRAQTLANIANSIADKDPSTAKAVLTECFHLLEKIKDPQNTVTPYVDIAETAHKIKDDERARLAIDKALTGATALYKSDVNADAPNQALREYWPSTQSYRRIIYRATTMYGVNAEYILPSITDSDLQLLASIEMARALLKKPAKSGSVSVSRSGKR